MTDLVPYDHARILLAEAKTVDDVKDILDKAAAMAEYRRRAGDRSLEIDAIEIRLFAERRLGQMLAAQEATVGLNRGRAGAGRPRLGGTAEEPPKSGPENPDLRPTLADAGITKKLSAKARKMAALPPSEFEAKLATWRAAALTEDRVTTNLLHVGREEEQRESRRGIAAALSDTSHELTGDRTFACVYLDPAYARKAGIGDRAYENHYRTEKWDGILKIMAKVAPRLQPNAWAFIWIPRAHMLALHPVKYKVQIDDGSIHEVQIRIPLIWAIARSLGMDEYSSCFVWTKTDEDHPDEHGTFLLVRDQDEILCLYKKGDGLPRPKPEAIFGSNHRERSRPLGHSRKPQFYRQMIAAMTGGLPVLELFARADADHPLPANWEAWGNESTSSDVPGSPQADKTDPTISGHQQGLDTSSNPGTADNRPHGEGSDAANVAKPEQHPVDAEPHAAPGASETLDEISRDIETMRRTARLQAVADPEHHRWEGEGGRILPDDDLVIVKPARASRAGAA